MSLNMWMLVMFAPQQHYIGLMAFKPTTTTTTTKKNVGSSKLWERYLQASNLQIGLDHVCESENAKAV